MHQLTEGQRAVLEQIGEGLLALQEVWQRQLQVKKRGRWLARCGLRMEKG